MSRNDVDVLFDWFDSVLFKGDGNLVVPTVDNLYDFKQMFLDDLDCIIEDNEKGY